MHRPVFASTSQNNGILYRVTSTAIETLLTSSDVDMYNFPSSFSRYHALFINPGKCSQTKTTADYDFSKAILVNLRRMEVEKCIDINYVGCGDGNRAAANGEACDDGNLNTGDGCSSTCLIETMYSCTNLEG
jgi:cysteine-rich repeat protein